VSTDFTLYAVSDEHVDMARIYMRQSLGYGPITTASMIGVINTAAVMDRLGVRDSALAIFDVAPSIVVDSDHTGEDGFCEVLTDLIGANLPVIDEALTRRILGLMPTGWSGLLEWPRAADERRDYEHIQGWRDFPAEGSTWDTPASVWRNNDTNRDVPQVRGLNPRIMRALLEGFLTGARGRRLWYCYI
jgi:hypothetical protein